MTAYLDKAKEIDHLDDSIADAATFLNQEDGWTGAWERQVSPLREDLALVEPLLTSELPEPARDLPAGDRLRELAAEVTTRLEAIRPRVEARAMSPDEALDELRAIRSELSDRLDLLSRAVVQALGSTDKERDTLEAAMRAARAKRTVEPTILGTAYPFATYFPVHTFSDGVNEGQEQIAPAGGSGVSSGYSGAAASAGPGAPPAFEARENR